MIAAFSLFEGRIAPVFDEATRILLASSEPGECTVSREHDLNSRDSMGKIDEIAALKAKLIVCGAISRPVYGFAVSRGLEVVPFMSGSAARMAAVWIENNSIDKSRCMPGCSGQGGLAFKNRTRWCREAITMNSGNGNQAGQQSGRGCGMGMGGGGGQGRGRGMGGQGQGQGQGAGMGRMGGRGAGPGSNCVCPSCGEEVAHQRGIPCPDVKCPKCGASMVRQ